MSEMLGNLQHRLRGASASIAISTYRLFFGSFLGLTFALIGERAANYGSLAFTFVIISVGLAFYKISKPWKLSTVLVFSLICVLIGLLLRLYIQVAPGS